MSNYPDYAAYQLEEEVIIEHKRLFDFFHKTNSSESIGGSSRIVNYLRLSNVAAGCRERWLQGEMGLSGYAVDSILLENGKADFSYPQNVPPLVIGELKLWYGGSYKEPEGLKGLVIAIEKGEKLGIMERTTRLPKEERWGLLSDYYRLKKCPLQVIKFLLLVVEMKMVSRKKGWGQVVASQNLAFHDSRELPSIVENEDIWIRVWEINNRLRVRKPAAL